jgi:hypothetical protein
MKLRIVGQETAYDYQKLTSALQAAGIDVVSDDTFDYVLPMYDTLSEQCLQLAQAAGKSFPDTAFINKATLEQKCVESEIATLPSFELSRDALLSCAYPHFIIKPVMSTGGKHPLPWVYKIFSNAQIAEVLTMIGNDSDESLSQFMVQQALIDGDTRLTYLLFVDGAVNGAGNIHFNSIAEKWMLDPTELDSHITHRVGIREVSQQDKYGFKAKVTKLLIDNNIRNTLFKAQALVDLVGNQCYINDWSWTIMPYTHLHVLDASYVVDHLSFAYDVIPSVTKPIEKAIVMHHVAFPTTDYALTPEAFDSKYEALRNQHGVVRAERMLKMNMAAPTVSSFFVLHGIACDDVEIGKAALAAFQTAVEQL